MLAPGHKTCAGCGSILAIRQVLEASGSDIVVCNATGCIEVTTSQYPTTSWKAPFIHVAFENCVPVASGVKAALESIGNNHTQVIALGGDGALFDIGFGSLSGALERKDNIIIICYDNEAYSNTGMQRSSATPKYASTTTTPYGEKIHGKQQEKKNITEIVSTHSIPYIATASIAFPDDLQNKIKKALSIKGPRFVHIHCPCPVGWGFDSSETIEIARLAVKSGLYKLYEIENSVKTHTFKDYNKNLVKEYLSKQKRFEKLSEKEIKEIENNIP